MRKRKHVRFFWFEPTDCSFQHLHQTLVEQRYTGGGLSATNLVLSQRRQPQLCRLAGNAEWLQTVRAGTLGNSVRYVDYGLRGLTDWAGRDHFVRQRIDCRYAVFVLEANIDSRAVSAGPDAMRQPANRNSRDLLKVIGAKHFDLVEPADRDIGEHAVRIAHDIDVIGDRTGVERFQKSEGRPRIEDLSLADIFESKPDLRTIRCRGNVRAEWAGLHHLADDHVVGDSYDVGLRRER